MGYSFILYNIIYWVYFRCFWALSALFFIIPACIDYLNYVSYVRDFVVQESLSFISEFLFQNLFIFSKAISRYTYVESLGLPCSILQCQYCMIKIYVSDHTVQHFGLGIKRNDTWNRFITALESHIQCLSGFYCVKQSTYSEAVSNLRGLFFSERSSASKYQLLVFMEPTLNQDQYHLPKKQY